MAHRELQRDPAAHAVADHVGCLDPEVLRQRGRVVGHLLIRERAVDVGRAPVALLFDGDHLPGRGQARQDRSHHVDGHVRAVQQEQRRALAVDLVVHVELVDWCVARLGRCHPLPLHPVPSGPRVPHRAGIVAVALPLTAVRRPGYVLGRMAHGPPAAALLERDDERAGLRAALTGAAEGRGSVVLIEGPPGIGKTRLLDDAAAAAPEHGVTVLRARAHELEQRVPYAVVRSLFADALAGPEADAAGAGAARVLGAARGAPGGARRPGAWCTACTRSRRRSRHARRTRCSSTTCSGPTPLRSASCSTSPGGRTRIPSR